MKQVTWLPDTCVSPSCQITFEFDETLPNDSQTFTPVRIIPCKAHENLSLIDNWNACLNENQSKNKVLSAIVTEAPSLTELVNTKDERLMKLKLGLISKEEFIQLGGSSDTFETRIKDDITISWVFNKQRELEITINDNSIDKMSLEAALASYSVVGIKVK